MGFISKIRKIFNLSLTDPKAWDRSLWNLYGAQSLSGEIVTEETALTYSAVYNAISLISGTVGSLPLHLMQKQGKDKQNFDQLPLYRVMHDQWNPYMTAMAGRETLTSHILAWGNGYAEIVRNGYRDIVELWPITPDRIVAIRIVDGDLKYDIRVGNETITLPRRQILHIPGLGFDGFRGYSVVSMAAKSIGLGMALETFGSLYFGQGTHPGIVVSHPNQLNTEAHKNLKTSLTETYSGLGKSHRLMLLEDGMKLENIGIPPNDSQFLECVTPDTLFSMYDGSLVPAKHINIGDIIIGWSDGKPIPAKVKVVAPPKNKRLIKIRTARGRELIASEDHPCLGIVKLRTPGGRIHKNNPEKWIPLKDIEVGNYLRIGLGMPETNSGMSFLEAYFLGAMVGDGYIRKGCCTFCSDNVGIIQKVRNACLSLNGDLKERKTKGNSYNHEIITNGVGVKGSPIRTLLNISGLVGKHSHTKFVPEIIFTGGPDAWRGFLSGFFDTDGSIRDSSGKQTPALYWASTSIELLKGCQHLLDMLGIQSAIYKMYNGGTKKIMGQMCETKKSWGLYVMSNSQLGKAADILSLSHSEKATRLLKYVNPGNSRYREINFLYDRVISVGSLGEGKTIGIEIEGCHTHITNGLVTHNSRQFQIPEIARWFNLPPHKLKDLTKSSFNNIEAEQTSFVMDSILPWLVRFEQNYNMQLLSKSEKEQKRLYLKHIVEGLLRANSKDRAEYYKLMVGNGLMTPNEVREKEDMNPSADPLMDEHWMPTGLIPLSKFDEYLSKNQGKPSLGTLQQVEPGTVTARLIEMHKKTGES